MPRPKGSQNKITTEVKEKQQNLIDTVAILLSSSLVDSCDNTDEEKTKIRSIESVFFIF